ncbi:MAG: hypothetical protein M3Q75_04245 [Gemmatimonadota bacterium]|nr:hypothetical protein [Gemmatimonadota bacterium]
MTIASFTVTRDVTAEEQDGTPCKIALATVFHENGAEQTIAIREDLIEFAGEYIIEEEVMRAMGSPNDTSLQFVKGRRSTQ